MLIPVMIIKLLIWLMRKFFIYIVAFLIVSYNTTAKKQKLFTEEDFFDWKKCRFR